MAITSNFHCLKIVYGCDRHNLAKKYPEMVIGFDKVMKEMRTPSENWPIPEDAESGKK